ncbi:pH-response regulator protein palH/RIM21 [Verticillium dahliae VdLs.17]|uniref:PH-response regulator protein palH/RIM21 n=1 Tax=Verticillium dahliae (strain VdLs.17 / ATCC MYA-4575 / FGSC 10137) TaxID=498257 RepID=G2X939_VERDV|nr:pH-response regulator protein palH/RIM21 [Verticillium dahliae VdLs.17]EGY15507.1 pH-response regulator protein palH/RIM21 [Verticillium dahliae VdLs.17]KAH6687577.1 pH-response regulator protein palH/RIM21 [Verticillium dahliae]
MAASVSSWLAAATPTPTLASVASKCATTLSVGAVLSFGPGHPLTTLTHAAILETPCAAGQTPTSSSLPSVLLANAEGIDALDTETSGGSPQFSDFRDAFYESTFPVCYVLAATTVTAYMLVIMLFVTPRSFLDGGVAYLGRSGFTGSSPNGISIGGRPPEFIGWGEYVRWVGAAAASVVVWEWVERIEALEREEKKDGILGREVFDGDEMVEASASDFPWLRRRRNRKSQAGGGAGSSGAAGNGAGAGDSGGGGGGDGGQGTSTAARLMAWPGLTSIPSKYQGNFRQQQQQQQQQQSAARSADATQQARVSAVGTIQPPLWPARPPPAITPVSRADTASAASTDYAVRYKPASDTTNRTPDTHLRRTPPAAATIPASAPVRPSTSSSTSRSTRTTESDSDGVAVAAPVPRQAAVAKNIDPEAQQTDTTTQGRSRWRALTTAANPLFNRQGRDRPPAAVAPHTAAAAGEHRTRDQYAGSGGRWDLRARLEDFAATQAEKVREKMQPTPETDSLPVTVIPAPPRQGAALARLLEEEGIDDRRSPLERSTSGGSGFSSFPGIGAGALPHALDRTTIDVSRQAPRGMGASVDTASVNANPSRPPLWPGVRAQPSYERTATTTTTTTYEYEDASDVQTPTEHSRRETEGSRGPPGP